jgi:hypothetical protein
MKIALLFAAFCVALLTSCTTTATYQGRVVLDGYRGGYGQQRAHRRCGGCDQVHARGVRCRAYPCGEASCSPSRTSVYRRTPVYNQGCNRGYQSRPTNYCQSSSSSYRSRSPIRLTGGYTSQNPYRRPSSYYRQRDLQRERYHRARSEYLGYRTVPAWQNIRPTF